MPYRKQLGLTKGEIRVARALLTGADAAEAAQMLGLSPRTVEVHRAHIRLKLMARSNLHLGYLLARLGHEPLEPQPADPSLHELLPRRPFAGASSPGRPRLIRPAPAKE